MEEFERIVAELKLPYGEFIDDAVPENRHCGVCPTDLPEQTQACCRQMTEARVSEASAPVSRRPLHLRRIACEGFLRDDGLIDIECLFVDAKPNPLRLVSKVVPAGEPIHQMRVRLTIDGERLKRRRSSAACANPPPSSAASRW